RGRPLATQQRWPPPRRGVGTVTVRVGSGGTTRWYAPRSGPGSAAYRIAGSLLTGRPVVRSTTLDEVALGQSGSIDAAPSGPYGAAADARPPTTTGWYAVDAPGPATGSRRRADCRDPRPTTDR